MCVDTRSIPVKPERGTRVRNGKKKCVFLQDEKETLIEKTCRKLKDDHVAARSERKCLAEPTLAHHLPHCRSAAWALGPLGKVQGKLTRSALHLRAAQAISFCGDPQGHQRVYGVISLQHPRPDSDARPHLASLDGSILLMGTCLVIICLLVTSRAVQIFPRMLYMKDCVRCCQGLLPNN